MFPTHRLVLFDNISPTIRIAGKRWELKEADLGEIYDDEKIPRQFRYFAPAA